MYVFTCPVFLSQNAGPYAPTKDTYYEKEALPKGPLTNVKVRDNISVYAYLCTSKDTDGCNFEQTCHSCC